MTVAQFANSQYGYMAVTFAVSIVAKRVVSLRTADLLTAVVLGVWVGSENGFWQGMAVLAVATTTLLGGAYLVGVAIGVWRVRRQLLTRVLGR